MMYFLSVFLLLAGFFLLTGTVTAEGIHWEKPVYGGGGCPSGSAQISLTKSQGSLTASLTQFRSQAGGPLQTRFDRKACLMSIPFRLSSGKKIVVTSVDFRGKNEIPADAKAELQTEVFFAGTRGPKVKKEFSERLDQSGQEEPFHFSWSGESLSYSSPCGGEGVLRAQFGLTAFSTGLSDQKVSIHVENAKLRFEIRDCVRES